MNMSSMNIYCVHEATNWEDLFSCVNIWSGLIFYDYLYFVISLAIIGIFYFTNRSTPNAMTYGGMATSVIGLFIANAGYISFSFPLILFVLGLCGLGLMILTKSED